MPLQRAAAKVKQTKTQTETIKNVTSTIQLSKTHLRNKNYTLKINEAFTNKAIQRKKWKKHLKIQLLLTMIFRKQKLLTEQITKFLDYLKTN